MPIKSPATITPSPNWLSTLKHPSFPGLALALGIGLLYFILGQKHYFQDLNVTFLIATSLLQGHLGLTTPYPWLELVPLSGYYYSVFPLGAILSVLPASLSVYAHITATYPIAIIVALIAAGCAGLAYACTFIRPEFTTPKRLLLASWLTLGTWFMTNLLFSGAWQIALGFAVLGELGAIYFTCVRPRPFLAGIYFALAFGNRTEIIITAPILLAFLLRPHLKHIKKPETTRLIIRLTLLFCLIPVIIGILTLLYNHARFGSFTDFGYARLPGILNEPLYRDGIFSFLPVTENARQMLWQGWKSLPVWPYWVPTGFGGSIILASPFLLLLLRRPKGNALRLTGSLLSIVALTFTLWLHGNPGGWQFSYRYAMVLLPWFLLLYIELLPKHITRTEIALWLVSVATNAYATYLFLWTNYVRP